MIFNDDQKNAIEEIKHFIYGKHKEFLLEGPAGSGKTTLITYILEHYFKALNIIFSAPTHKAVNVLKSNLNNYNDERVKFMTIHRLLGIKRKINSDGEIYFDDIDDEIENALDMNFASKANIIIVDEASMISDSIYNMIQKFLMRKKCKIIFVGDRNQLPPVNEIISKVFNGKIEYFKLTKIERYKNGIVKYANSVINKIRIKKGDVKPEVEFIKDESLWLNSYFKDYQTSTLLAYTNKRVEQLNKIVRKKIIGRTEERFVKDDKIIFNSYYLGNAGESYYTSQIEIIDYVEIINKEIVKFPINQILNMKIISGSNLKIKPIDSMNEACPCCLEEEINSAYETVCGHKFCTSCLKIWLQKNNMCPMCRCEIKSNDELVIKNDSKLSHIVNLFNKKTQSISFKTYKINLINEEKKEKTIYVIHDDDLEKYEIYKRFMYNILQDMKEHIFSKSKDKFNISILSNLWNYFYMEIIDKFANIVYGYALTIHKSQGSTYQNVYIDYNNININRNDKEQCFYTGITRASKNIKIYI